MIKSFDYVLNFISGYGNSWISIFIFILLLAAFLPLADLLFGKLLRKWNFSKNDNDSIKMILVGSVFIAVALGVYIFSKKFFFAWFFCPIALIVGGGLGLIPFTFGIKISNKSTNSQQIILINSLIVIVVALIRMVFSILSFIEKGSICITFYTLLNTLVLVLWIVLAFLTLKLINSARIGMVLLSVYCIVALFWTNAFTPAHPLDYFFKVFLCSLFYIIQIIIFLNPRILRNFK